MRPGDAYHIHNKQHHNQLKHHFIVHELGNVKYFKHDLVPDNFAVEYVLKHLDYSRLYDRTYVNYLVHRRLDNHKFCPDIDYHTVEHHNDFH
jgi:hypothetical protein